MNDLQVVINHKVGVINFDFEKAKAEAVKKVSAYKGLIVTEDMIAPAKKDVASLNNDIKEFNAARIAAKKEYLKPFDDFETKLEGVITVYEDAVASIKKQLDEYEVDRKATKKSEIERIYNESIGEMKDFLPLSKIYDIKWENVGLTLKSIRTEIENVVASTTIAVQSIKGMKSEIEDKVLEQYKRDLSLPNAITSINKYEAQKAEILAKEEAKRKAEEERKRLADEQRIKDEERKRIADEKRIEEEAIKKAEEKFVQNSEPTPVSINTKPNFIECSTPQKVDPMPIVIDVEDDERPFEVEEPPFTIRNWVDLKICVTPEELSTIESFLNSIGVTYRNGGQ